MTSDKDPVTSVEADGPYSTLPSAVPLDETIAGVRTHEVMDADVVRNLDQHQALRDD